MSEAIGTLAPESLHPMVRIMGEHQAALDSVRATFAQVGEATVPLERAAQLAYVEADRAATESLERSSGASFGRPRHEMPFSKTTEFLVARRAFENDFLARRLLPQSLLVAMVSQHDAFMGRLIRWVFAARPDLRAKVKRSFDYGECSQAGSLKALLEKLVEDEIREVLHSSHTAQLNWLSDLLEVRLDSDPELLKRFREVVQRRHIYAHNAGVPTARYIEARRAVEPDFVGAGLVELELDPETFNAAFFTLMEIAVKLWQTVWRKTRWDEEELAEEAVYKLGYNLLVFEEFHLAVCVLEFALSYKRFKNENVRRKNIVNLAQAYKWLGDEQACQERLNEDWSAVEDSFRLAVAVLNEDFSLAERLMLSVGKSGDIVEQAFLDWPLFRRFRDTDQFKRTFAQLYGAQHHEHAA